MLESTQKWESGVLPYTLHTMRLMSPLTTLGFLSGDNPCLPLSISTQFLGSFFPIICLISVPSPQLAACGV